MIDLDEYLDEPDKITRARNLLETQEGRLDYHQEFGVDKDITSGVYDIQDQAIISYFRQMAFKQGLVFTGAEESEEDFTRIIQFTVED